ncbi:carbohydrate ABC transporter permease [Nitratireductor aquimarinus]|uniref:carbohydrate ABC transporter permease n=1 Tax=Nitratireductor aquimarinus TaxID=889300 RepID=UPI0029356C0D|nr:carbohydrate ABC transporter permease [Nitratireductor aquimarinus]MDV2966694.1 carbohydrate ABC transporter permease [Nitratireductor aquimarinus]
MSRTYHTIKYLCLVAWSIFVVFPFLWALSTSFKDANAVTSGARYIPWLEFEPSTQGWASLFASGSRGINIVTPFINSATVTLTASIISLALGTLAAYGLSRYQFRAGFVKNADITFFFISQRIMPPIVLAIPFFLMLKEIGALDTIVGLVIVYIALLLPIAVWVMIDFFGSIPRELDEMAMIDGCTPVGAFFRVILPNSMAGLVVAGMFCLIFGWNDFFFAFTLTFTKTQLLPVAIVSLNSSVTPWWSLSAFALISVTPLALVAIVVERFMSRGSLAGAFR